MTMVSSVVEDDPDNMGELPTPEALIHDKVENMRNSGAIDGPLFDILAQHILTTTPAATAVTEAATAIEELARKRAEGFSNDEANHA